MSDVYLELVGLTKRFGESIAVDSVELAVERGSVLALLGPSGSGKTTTLRLLAGFERPDSGRIVVDGKDVTTQPPVERRFGMVFQHYALFPHLTVAENIAFGLAEKSAAEQRSRVAEVLSLVDLEGFGEREVTALSGGQQQRVAVARALAPEPRVLLLDEPLSALDYSLRKDMQIELKMLQRQLDITFILVTHDQEEALSMSDRVVVMSTGKVEQVGTPRAVYEKPQNLYVAKFIGATNIFETHIEDVSNKTVTVDVEGKKFTLETSRTFQTGQKVNIVVRID